MYSTFSSSHSESSSDSRMNTRLFRGSLKTPLMNYESIFMDSTSSSRNGRATRSSLACLPCRSRHLKCDGKRPHCARCSEVGKQCGYAPLLNISILVCLGWIQTPAPLASFCKQHIQAILKMIHWLIHTTRTFTSATLSSYHKNSWYSYTTVSGSAQAMRLCTTNCCSMLCWESIPYLRMVNITKRVPWKIHFRSVSIRSNYGPMPTLILHGLILVQLQDWSRNYRWTWQLSLLLICKCFVTNLWRLREPTILWWGSLGDNKHGGCCTLSTHTTPAPWPRRTFKLWILMQQRDGIMVKELSIFMLNHF